MTVKPTISYINHMLRENNPPVPKREDTENVGLKVLDSDF